MCRRFTCRQGQMRSIRVQSTGNCLFSAFNLGIRLLGVGPGARLHWAPPRWLRLHRFHLWKLHVPRLMLPRSKPHFPWAWMTKTRKAVTSWCRCRFLSNGAGSRGRQSTPRPTFRTRGRRIWFSNSGKRICTERHKQNPSDVQATLMAGMHRVAAAELANIQLMCRLTLDACCTPTQHSRPGRS